MKPEFTSDPLVQKVIDEICDLLLDKKLTHSQYFICYVVLNNRKVAQMIMKLAGRTINRTDPSRPE